MDRFRDSGLRIWHNHVRPHLGLPDGQTPGEAAGIRIEGGNKWKTIIQAAAKSKAAYAFRLGTKIYIRRDPRAIRASH